MNHPSFQPLRPLDDPPHDILLFIFMIHRNLLRIQAIFNHSTYSSRPFGPGGGLFTPAKSGIRWRFLWSLNSYLRSIRLTILDNIQFHEIRNHVKRIAVPKREEGIGGLRDLSWSPIGSYLPPLPC
jgi:hypothetical protein